MPNTDTITVTEVNNTRRFQHAELRIPLTPEEHADALKALTLLTSLRERALAALEVEEEDDGWETFLNLRGVRDDGSVVIDFAQVKG